MKLFNQIWISILALMIIVFIGSGYINLSNAKIYLEEQLLAKNLDNANALAGVLANGNNDDELLKLTIQAHFDLGHYQEISFKKPDGNTLLSLSNAPQITTKIKKTEVPVWFEHATEIQSKPGVAVLSKGWRQLGQLTVVSSNNDATLSLWNAFQQTLIWFLLNFILFGLISYYFIHHLTKTLSDVVKQAKAIGERRFSLSAVPRTFELKQLVNTMNRTTKRIRKILAKDTQRIEALRNETQRDKLTGFFNYDFFIQSLSLEMKPSHQLYQGYVVLIKIDGLDELNQAQGWEFSDQAIVLFSEILKGIAVNDENIIVSRLGGGSFAIAVPSWSKPQGLEKTISEAWSHHVAKEPLFHALNLRLAYAKLVPDLDVQNLIDNSLSNALSFGDHWSTASAHAESWHHDIDAWSHIIAEAIKTQRLNYELYKVLNAQSKIIHYEASVNFKSELNDHIFNAGSFLPWAIRTKQIVLIDAEIVKLAFAQIVRDQIPIAVNLDIQSLADRHFLIELEMLLQRNPSCAKYLYLEIPAKLLFDHLEEFSRFCMRVIPQGVKIGIDNIGLEVSDFSKIRNLGIHYIKIHPALIHQFTTNASNVPTLANLLLISRSMGFMVIANGVQHEDHIQRILDFGFDGVTGPAIGAEKSFGPHG